MPKLTEAIKTLIVTEYAMFSTPTEIIERVKEEFSVPLDRGHVHLYNPDGCHAGALAKKWKTLHAATRKQFLKDTSSIPVAQRAYRLRKLNDMTQKANSRGNIQLAASLMEQAAKECGDSYTNRQVVKVNGAVGTYQTTPEQIDAEIRAILGGGDAPTGD